MASTAGDTNSRRRPRPRNGATPEAPALAGESSGLRKSTGSVAETRWLNSDELAAWLANSAIMISLPAALDARMQREAQLTFFEYMVLSVLSEQPARTMQMSALAARTAASLSRLSHVVGRLEKRELLARNRIPGSGRRTAATLTEAGYEVVVAAAPGHVAAVREYLIDDLGPEELAALRRIGAAVDAAIKREQPDTLSAASPPPEAPTIRRGPRRTAD
ncbi:MULTISPECIES: MarR family winged helix-turn-helix transcriptional regulator [Streptomyces]|uniref:MarR family winged helix-turn-helix transcriptional regulator n=1 Tax=Streptomyces TaxID=1883 RepID=UPI0021D04EBF|nr:MarR family transcriptional regulator [Streptomyces sp. G-5]MCU4749920.1 MarR family transcriptional regulator [Streptomyces sp. G-5]